MAWPVIAMAAAGALAGGLNSGDKTTTSKSDNYLSAYGGNDRVDWLLNQNKQNWGDYQRGQPTSTYAEQNYLNSQGGGGGGGGNNPWMQMPGGGGGGGGGGPKNYAGILNQGGGGGGGGGQGGQPFLNWHSTPDQYQKAILEGQNLDVANNPYVQGINSSIANQMQTGLARSMPSLQAAAGGMGRTGGGAAAAQEALAQGEMLRNLGSAQSENMMNAWNTGMGQQTSVLGDVNQATMAGRTNWQQDIANQRTTSAQRAAARMSSIASMYGSDAAANASRYSSRLGLQGTLAGVRASDLASRRSAGVAGRQNRFNNAMSVDQFNRDKAFDPMRAFSMTQGNMMPIMQGFGHQYGTASQTTPGQGALAGALQGGMSGAAMGMGMQGMFGGGGGGGGYDTSAYNQYGPAWAAQSGLGR